MKFKLPSELTRILAIVRPFKINKYLKENTDPKLHIGSGLNYKEGWLNADKFDSGADIYLDGYQRMPFKDKTFNYLYSEHTLEHMKITKVQFFLEECMRVLKPNGIFRITVPDLEIFATKYVERDGEFFKPYLDKFEPRSRNGKSKYWMVRSYGGILNLIGTKYFFHHRWFYDFETLEKCCKEVGFQKIERKSFRESKIEFLGQMDRETRKHETLYIELSK